MKRTRNVSQSDNDMFTTPSTSYAARSRTSKRPKSIQACTSCRKHKTRCEILEQIAPDTVVQCHRCKVLGVQCSYSEMDRSFFQQHIQQQQETSRGDGSSSTIPLPSPMAAAIPSDNILHEYVSEKFPSIDGMWSFIERSNSFDWSAPMVAIQELSRQPSDEEPAPLPAIPDNSVDDILSPDQKRTLLDLFDAQYVPWLNFELVRENGGPTPVLDLACCIVASRHLHENTSTLVSPRLQKLTEDTVIKMIFNPRSAESIESIQTLLILSLWSPVYKGGSGIRDGRLLIASAVSMAMNLRLSEASRKVIEMRSTKLKPDGTPASDEDLADLTDKARVWICLTNAESLLCMGSGRMPLSRRSLTDLQLTAIGANTPTALPELRDYRMRLMGELFNSVEQSQTVKLQSVADVEHWHDHITLIIANLDRLKRLIQPLPVVLEADRFYFRMLLLLQFACRLLIVYLSMSDAFAVYKSSNSGPFWFLDVRPRGITVMVNWGKDTLQTAESLMTEFLQVDTRLLGTVPDSIFDMLGFSACFVISVKFMMLRSTGHELLGSTDLLLTKTRDVLASVPFERDHAAKRCAHLVSIMISIWHNRDQHLQQRAPQSSMNFQHATPQHSQHRPPPPRSTSMSSSSSGSVPGSGSGTAENSPADSASLPTPQYTETLPEPYLIFENMLPIQIPAGAIDGTTPDMWAATPSLSQDSDFWNRFFGTDEWSGWRPEV